MINWLFNRLTPAKRTESRWAELTSTLEGIWAVDLDAEQSGIFVLSRKLGKVVEKNGVRFALLFEQNGRRLVVGGRHGTGLPAFCRAGAGLRRI